MQVHVSTHDSVAVLELEGRMDATSTAEFDTVAHARLGQGARYIVVDMSRLEYISSAGLRSVLGLARAVRGAAGGLAFCGLQPMVAEVFRISGFSGILTVCESREAALAAVCGEVSAQQKQSKIAYVAFSNIDNYITIDTATVRVWYALNALDINDENSYID